MRSGKALSPLLWLTPDVNQCAVPLLRERHRDLPAACHCSRARRGLWCFVLSHRSHCCLRQSRSPAEPDPLLDVIGHTCPEGFHPYLEEPPETELPEAYPLLDPGMGEFGDCRPLLVDLLRLFRFHLLREGDNRRVID